MTRVLVVEDEGIIAKDLQVTLRRMGYEVPETASNGLDAIDAALRLQPDLILMDIHLQGDMDGTEAAQRIRHVHDAAVVYLTAYADAETLDRAQGAEPYGYLVKPFEEETLRTTIETALRRRAEDQGRERDRSLQAAALDLVGEGLLLVDAAGVVRHANRHAVDALGADPSGSPLYAMARARDEEGGGAQAWMRLRDARTPRVWNVGEHTVTLSVQRVPDAFVVVLTHGDQVTQHVRHRKRAVSDLLQRAHDLV